MLLAIILISIASCDTTAPGTHYIRFWVGYGYYAGPWTNPETTIQLLENNVVRFEKKISRTECNGDPIDPQEQVKRYRSIAINDIPPGRYTMKMTALGYREEVRTIDLYNNLYEIVTLRK